MNKLRPLLALLLVVCMLPVLIVSAHPFDDVPVGCWYDEAVEFVYEYNFMNGTSNTTFSPGIAMNRAMIVTVLYRMAGCPTVKGPCQFIDVSPAAYYYYAVKWAYDNGITMGVSNTEFAPARNITRAEIATMFYRCYGEDYKGSDSVLKEYDDVDKIPEFAYDAFIWAISNDIIHGMSKDTLSPITTSNRAQCAVMIQRLAEVVELEMPKEYVLKLDKSVVKMFVGDTLKLNVTYTGEKELTWKSHNETVATVDNGVVKALDEGIAYVTVSDGDKNATCKIEVEAHKTVIRIIPPQEAITVGKTYQFKAEVTGKVGKLIWESLNEKAATIDQNGLLTALAEGNCGVYVTDGHVEAVYCFRVEAEQILAEEIEILNTDGPFYDGVTRYKGDYVILTLANKPNEAIQTVSASSSDTDIITSSVEHVNGGGFCKITLNFKSAGTATITLTSDDGAVSQSYTITVKDGYDFDPGDRQLTPEEFADYTTRVMCANGFEETTSSGSWRQLTLSKAKLNFEVAIGLGLDLVHEWWANGCRYCQIVYVGQNDNGDYVFRTYWG